MDPVTFKFHYVNEKGEQTTMFGKKGMLDDEHLTLGDATIPIAAIVEADVRDYFLILAVMTEKDEPATMVVKTGRAKWLKTELGRLRSAIWAEIRRKELEEEAQGHVFRSVTCPACRATLDLTGKEETPQVFCEFCHTISMLNGPSGTPESEHGFRLCDECGMYSKPHRFTIFYFYFLVFVYGWRTGSTWRCPGCMRPEAWKMLLGNLLFVLGVPVALVQLYRSYGGTSVGTKYAGLDGANLRARRGDITGAIGAYQKILERVPVTAGVKYNIGTALVQQNQLEEAAQMFEYSLADCSNYAPSASALAQCYTTLGAEEKLADLKRAWEGE